MATAEWMFGKIREMNPGHKSPNLQAWADTIRRIRERDGKTDTEIHDLFEWANQHEFWRTNILSPDTLRRQWDKLTIKQRGESNGRTQAAGSNGRHGGPVRSTSPARPRERIYNDG